MAAIFKVRTFCSGLSGDAAGDVGSGDVRFGDAGFGGVCFVGVCCCCGGVVSVPSMSSFMLTAAPFLIACT